MTFHPAVNADTNGTFLACHLPPEVRRAAMLARFGTPTTGGVWDHEKGYNGEEWAFIGSDGAVYNVYARWGMFRVGAHQADVATFAKWLTRELGVG